MIRDIPALSHLTEEQFNLLESEFASKEWRAGKGRAGEIAYQQATWLIRRAKEVAA